METRSESGDGSDGSGELTIFRSWFGEIGSLPLIGKEAWLGTHVLAEQAPTNLF